MNLLIGIVILLCLVCSEVRTAEAADDIWMRVIFVALITLTVPGIALFQTLIVSKKIRNSEMESGQQEGLLRRLSISHSAVWLAASLAIIWSARWQDVVRGNWQLDRWPLIDEAFILAPVVLSLVASWAIFYEVQNSIRQKSSSDISGNSTRGDFLKSSISSFKSRLAFVSIRFRVYFLLVLIPFSIAIVARDISPWIESLVWTKQYAVYGLALLVLLAGSPFALLLMWRNKPIADKELRAELLGTCQKHKIHVRDVRIWVTNGQVVNALVAGLIPKLRIILLSDALVQHFPSNELRAIVRHEAAHLRLWHLPTRIGLAILPLLAMAIDEQNPYGLMHSLDHAMAAMGLPNELGLVVIFAAYLGYMYFGFSWLSHKMEFEADIYAARSTDSQFDNCDDVVDALLRLAAFNSDQFEKSSFLHPSIASRIRLVQALKEHPQKAESFIRSFAQRKRIVFAALVLVTSLCAIALLI